MHLFRYLHDIQCVLCLILGRVWVCAVWFAVANINQERPFFRGKADSPGLLGHHTEKRLPAAKTGCKNKTWDAQICQSITLMNPFWYTGLYVQVRVHVVSKRHQLAYLRLFLVGMWNSDRQFQTELLAAALFGTQLTPASDSGAFTSKESTSKCSQSAYLVPKSKVPKVFVIYAYNWPSSLDLWTSSSRSACNLRGACIPLLVPELDQTPATSANQDGLRQCGLMWLYWQDIYIYMYICMYIYICIYIYYSA